MRLPSWSCRGPAHPTSSAVIPFPTILFQCRSFNLRYGSVPSSSLTTYTQSLTPSASALCPGPPFQLNSRSSHRLPLGHSEHHQLSHPPFTIAGRSSHSRNPEPTPSSNVVVSSSSVSRSRSVHLVVRRRVPRPRRSGTVLDRARSFAVLRPAGSPPTRSLVDALDSASFGSTSALVQARSPGLPRRLGRRPLVEQALQSRLSFCRASSRHRLVSTPNVFLQCGWHS